jgi:hypothetical protein
MAALREGRLSVATFCGLMASCAASPPAVSTAPSETSLTSASFADGQEPLPRYRSKRLALSLPLPQGRSWRIDDHSRPELIAVHPPTHSRVLVAIVRADDLVGRKQCEELALARKLVPESPVQILDEEVAVTQGTFDTRIRVTLRPSEDERGPLEGHVTAFGGFLRKCYVFDFSTEVARAADEPVLSSRLAFARARILGGLELDSFATISRARPDRRDAAPSP